jgi:flagellar assembly protein FliH
MLSKVIRHAETGSIETFTFQLVPGYSGAHQSRPASVEAAKTGNLPADQIATLDKIRKLEALVASESRAAFESGKQEAQKAAQSELQPVLQRLAASTAEVLSMRTELRHGAEADVVQLALLIARRILHRQLAVDESALTALARVAFDRLSRTESYRVTVHPRFAAALAAALPPAQASRVQIEQDPSCACGTLIIHSSEGTIDASVDTQLEEIGRGLADRLTKT